MTNKERIAATIDTLDAAIAALDKHAATTAVEKLGRASSQLFHLLNKRETAMKLAVKAKESPAMLTTRALEIEQFLYGDGDS